jgi:hypothetical protein
MALRETRMRQMIGSLALIFVLLQTTGCTGYVEGPGGISVGYTMEYTRPISGQTPVTFAAACSTAGGAVNEGTNDTGGAQTTCTMPNGDANTCDWLRQRCHAICHSEEDVCAVVRDLAWVAPWLREASPTVPTS